MTSEDLINRLEELFAMHGVLECMRIDNGPEFADMAVQQYLLLLDIKTLYARTCESMAIWIRQELQQHVPR